MACRPGSNPIGDSSLCPRRCAIGDSGTPHGRSTLAVGIHHVETDHDHEAGTVEWPEGRVTVTVNLPRVHMAGSNAQYNAHIEVGSHGFALFLAPDAETPALDIDGTAEQLNQLVRDLQAALAARSQ